MDSARQSFPNLRNNALGILTRSKSELVLVSKLRTWKGVAWARTAQDVSLDSSVIGSGGVHLAQGAVSLDNSLGQPVVGVYNDREAKHLSFSRLRGAIHKHFKNHFLVYNSLRNRPKPCLKRQSPLQ